jgi:hypothetical protein
VAKDLAVRPGQGRVDLRLFDLRRLGRAAARHGLGEPSRDLGPVLLLAHVHAGEDQRHHPLEKLRVAPEQVKGLIEDRPLVAPADQHGIQGPVEVVSPRKADGAQRLDGVDQLARSDGQPGGAQGASEMKKILDQPSVGARHPQARAAASSAFTCSRMRAASLPRILAMSS